MSDKISLQWNDFKENITSSFGKLRNNKDFTNVTLAFEDGRVMEAHKVILAASSPFFDNLLQKSKHTHPLIYLRGFESKDFVSILDFVYFGEANVNQEDFDSFVAIAEDIQLKGLTRQTSTNLIQDQEVTQHYKPIQKSREMLEKSTNPCLDLERWKHQYSTVNPIQSNPDLKHNRNVPIAPSTTVAVLNQSSIDLLALDRKVKSMMEHGQKMITTLKEMRNGTPKQETSRICRVCGKEGLPKHIRNHIEANHLEGLCIPCDFCDKTFSLRNSLTTHKGRFHK